MRECVNELDGKLEIQSDSHGTRIIVTVPLAAHCRRFDTPAGDSLEEFCRLKRFCLSGFRNLLNAVPSPRLSELCPSQMETKWFP